MAGIHVLDARAPEGMRLYAIGDVHGRLDLLRRMHAEIAEEVFRDRPADWRVIHLGDYVDRGPDSGGVIEFLAAAKTRDERFLFLCGNHDEGFLDFLADPSADGIFVNNGGGETMLSYGVDVDPNSPRSMVAAHAALEAAMPADHVDFLNRLRPSLSFGDFFFCHAGIRPGAPLDRQSARDLRWIRHEFLNHPGLFEKVVVHGHTPVRKAEIWPNRINVDTGAFRSGLLSAVAIEGNEKRILTVPG